MVRKRAGCDANGFIRRRTSSAAGSFQGFERGATANATQSQFLHHRSEKENKALHIISVQSIAGATGVTLTAAKLALSAIAEGQAVLAVDTSPYGVLNNDLDDAGFQFLDDDPQLFRPLKEASRKLSAMPRYGTLHCPESQPDYVTASPDGSCQMAFRERAGRGAEALFNLRRKIAWFYKHYDVIFVDVAAKDQLLMQYFYDVADEVHVMLRNSGAGKCTIGDWRAYIERPESDAPSPRIVARRDRQLVVSGANGPEKSSELRPFFERARFPTRPAVTNGKRSNRNDGATCFCACRPKDAESVSNIFLAGGSSLSGLSNQRYCRRLFAIGGAMAFRSA